MAIDREHAAYLATRRFGLGARPGDVERMRADPRGAVLAQLDPTAAHLDDLLLRPSAEVMRENWVYIDEEKRRREASRPAMSAAPDMAGGMGGASAPPRPTQPPLPGLRPEQRHYQAEATARLARQISTATPIVERLVNFWSNHFCVAISKSSFVKGIAGAYEREAIRPFVLGRFQDMMMASAHHPAMLLYLDNHVSVGPHSKAGLRTHAGFNENLGREILELHTVGVNGGYSEADVITFAAALTGWSVAGLKAKDAAPGTFHFFPDNHEPGVARILGKDYPQTGVDQAEAALADFAHHPATARHVARKLVRHFVGDRAPPDLADRLATVFRDTGGDLAAVTTALVQSDAAWDAPPAKVLSPWDLLVATGRMLGIEWNFDEASRMQALFGQPLWNVPFPQGWPDDDEAWAAPDSLLELLDAVSALAKRNAGDRDVSRLAAETLGPLLRPQTRQTVARAETRDAALALLIMSPDFLRR